MSETPRRRKKMILRLTPRQKSDPQSIIAAVRQVVKEQCDLVLEVRTIADESEPIAEAPEKRLALEEVETIVKAAVKGALDAADETAKAKPVEKEHQPAKWWEAVKGIGKFIADMAKIGWKAVVGEATKKATSE